MTDEQPKYTTLREAAERADAVVNELLPWLHERAPGTHIAMAATLASAAMIARQTGVSLKTFVDAAAAHYQFQRGKEKK